MGKSTLIVGHSHERATWYAREYGYPDAYCVGSDTKWLRGRMVDRIIIIDDLTKEQEQVLAPIKINAEVLYHSER